MPKPPTRRTAVYCRISQDSEKLGLGVARQQRACRELAQRAGLGDIVVYVDNDISAFSGKARPNYEQMLEHMESGRVTTVIAWHPDRLHRSMTELERFIDVVDSNKVDVLTVTAGNYDLTSSAGRMTARILGAVARGESEHKSERIRSKIAELVENGMPHAGTPHYGYNPDKLTINEPEAKVLREAARRLIAGDALRAIAADFNRRKIKTRRGAPWQPTTLRQMLRNPTIAGRRTHHGEDVGPAYWPAVLNESTWQRVCDVFAEPHRLNHTRPTLDNRRKLLTGFLVCGHCDLPMNSSVSARRGRDGTRYASVRSYTCRHCDKLCVKAEWIEGHVVAAIAERLGSRAFVIAVQRQGQDSGSSDVIEKIAAIERRLAAVNERYVAGKMSETAWATVTEGADGQLAPLRDELEQRRRDDNLADVAEYADRGAVLLEAWPELTVVEQRRIVARLIHKIVIAPGVRGAQSFDPERAEIDWAV